MSSSCSFCKSDDHVFKRKGVVVCPVLLNNQCHKCKQLGHTPKFCKQPSERPSEQPLKENTWASIAAKKRAPEIISQINVQEQQAAAELIKAKQKRALEREQRFLEREQRFLEREQKSLEREQLHAQKMFEKYGSNWYNYVDRTDEDCREAALLRDKEDQRVYEREEREKEDYKEFTALYDRNLKTMSESEFEQWQEELDDEFDSHVAQVEGAFTSRASQAAISYYHKTGIMRDSNDFVGNHAQAPLKPGIRF
jgi:hypothetical protein